MSATTTHDTLSVGTLLRLGRVSNLPTVWTNVAAATAIAGGDLLSGRSASVFAAMTLFYLGGMYLNDAFDRNIDARERPTRPIPSGQISAPAVFGAGLAMLALGTVLIGLNGVAAAVAGLALAGAILLYDYHHKGNPLGPVLMGSCRALVYIGAATAAVGSISVTVSLAGLAVLAHVVGLTYAAKQESLDRIDRLWPLAVLVLPLALGLPQFASGWAGMLAWLALAAADLLAVQELRRRSRPGAVPRSVAALIAAISLVDALFVATVSPAIAAACMAGYLVTRLLHRAIPGT